MGSWCLMGGVVEPPGGVVGVVAAAVGTPGPLGFFRRYEVFVAQSRGKRGKFFFSFFSFFFCRWAL
uniref:Uncharacterized protein n=1 Tax=Arundo donax TaxID=35708 RepID=A0A0A9GT89_ARUDO